MNHLPPEGSVRERRRAETVREIERAALAEVARAGAAQLSLRSVARSVGMTVQSIYHYFDGRDALLAAVAEQASRDLTDAVRATQVTAVANTLGRLDAATAAYREWAIGHREAFLLLNGFSGGGSDDAVQRLMRVFADVIFDGWSAAETAAVPAPGETALRSCGYGTGVLQQPGALALLVDVRARIHGLVMLELSGQLAGLQDAGAALMTAAARRMSDEVDALRRA